MKKRLFLGLFGMGVVAFSVRQIRKEIKKHTHEDEKFANIWLWTITLWELSTAINALAAKTHFGNEEWEKKIKKCVEAVDLKRHSLPIDFTKEYWDGAFGEALQSFDVDRRELAAALSSEDAKKLRVAARDLLKTCILFDRYFEEKTKIKKRIGNIDTAEAS